MNLKEINVIRIVKSRLHECAMRLGKSRRKINQNAFFKCFTSSMRPWGLSPSSRNIPSNCGLPKYRVEVLNVKLLRFLGQRMPESFSMKEISASLS